MYIGNDLPPGIGIRLIHTSTPRYTYTVVSIAWYILLLLECHIHYCALAVMSSSRSLSMVADMSSEIALVQSVV